MTEKMNYTISLDWLQVYALGEEITDEIVKGKALSYHAKLQSYSTPMFERLYFIYAGRQKVAEIQQKPRTSTINEKATTIKIENRVLYSTQYIQILYDVLKIYNLRYKGITRVDVALDCQELANGQDIQEFLRRCVALREDENGFLYNVGRNHTTFHTTRANGGHARINSVRWGSPQSRITCYCYDKTLELIEKKDKPWIREFWEKNGLDYQYNDDELLAMTEKQKDRLTRRIGLADYVTRPVWRFEISIKGQGKSVMDLETGELFSLDTDNVMSQLQVRELFFAYAEKCFKFRENTGQKNARFFHDVQIFDRHDRTYYMPKYVSTKQESGRTEKIVYNKITKIIDQLPEEEDELIYYMKRTARYFANLSGAKYWLYENRIRSRSMERPAETDTLKTWSNEVINQIFNRSTQLSRYEQARYERMRLLYENYTEDDRCIQNDMSLYRSLNKYNMWDPRPEVNALQFATS